MNALAIAALLLGIVLILIGVVLILRDAELPGRGVAYRAYAALLVLAGTAIALMPLLFMAGVR